MRISRSTIQLGIVLGLAVIFSATPSALAHDEERTTASEVVDRDTLKAFVLGARDYISNITDIDELVALADVLRNEEWKHENTYLIISELNGILRFHGDGFALTGKDLSAVEDDNGEKVFPKMLAAARSMEDGDFVEYSWDDPSDPNDTNPKVCYAVAYSSPLAQSQFLLVGGYYQDLSDLGTDVGEFPDPPAITASDVVDRETLRAFVHGAVEYSFEAIGKFQVDFSKLLEEYKREGGPWRQGSTYLYAFTEEGYVIFHAARPDQEGRILLDAQTVNDFPVVRNLIEKAQEGGGFVEYYWDDPLVEGDEETGGPKIGYAEMLKFPDEFPVYAGQTIVIGSGLYKRNQMALDFAHFANGGSFSSDVVLVNLAATPIQPLVYFYGRDGELIDPGSIVDVTGNLEATTFGAVTLQSELPSLGEVTISTNGMGDLVTGSVKVVTEGLDSPIGGVLRFDAPGIGVAGVGASQAVRDAIIPVRRQTGGIDTGAALRNLSESEQTLTCRLMMGGETLEETPVTLPANGQTAMFISELFEHDTSDFTGSMRCTAPAGQQKFTGVAVELDTNNGIFTTLPVVPLSGE